MRKAVDRRIIRKNYRPNDLPVIMSNNIRPDRVRRVMIGPEKACNKGRKAATIHAEIVSEKSPKVNF